MGKTKGGTRLHGGEDILVELGLSSVRDEEHDKVGLCNDLKALPEGTFILREANLLGLLIGRRGWAQADGDLDISSGLVEGVAEVLGLGRSLGAPSNDADILDSFEGLGKEREEVTATLDNSLGGVSKFDFDRVEYIRRETVEKSIKAFTKREGE